MVADENSITQFFPIEPPPAPTPAIHDPSDEEVDEIARALMSQILDAPDDDSAEDESDTNSRNNQAYEAFRTADDLSGVARALYIAAGKVLRPLVTNP